VTIAMLVVHLLVPAFDGHDSQEKPPDPDIEIRQEKPVETLMAAEWQRSSPYFV